MSTVIQRSFSGGEIAPSLYARVDTAKYATGLRTCRNFSVMRHGGVQNRAGTKFVQEVSDSSKRIKLIPFVFNVDQTYVLEFGDEYMRVIKDGVQVREAAVNISSITQANPAVVTTSSPHGYATGAEVHIDGVLGMLQINNRNFKITVTGATTFSLQDMDGVTNINSSSYGAYVSGGTSEEVYEIATPYLEADLQDLQYVQSADVITIVHPTYAPRDLSRLGDTNWSLDVIDFNPQIDPPENLDVSVSTGSAQNHNYVVTAISEETGEESLVGGYVGTISAITNASPGVFTHSPGLATLEANGLVVISGVLGMTEVNGTWRINTTPSPTTFTLKSLSGTALDTTSFGVYTSGGTITQIGHSDNGDALSTSNPANITWDPVVGASEYIIYKEVNESGKFGFVGTSEHEYFVDTGIEPDAADNPPERVTLFQSADNYPSTVTYIQQRRAFANTNSDPERIWLSKIGAFKNFTTKTPIQDDDSLNFVMAGRQVNSVQQLLDIGQLVVLTQGGEWAVEGGVGNVITPSEINPKQYSYNGAKPLAPIIIGGNALYVQARGSIVRDLSFDFAVEGYRGNDLTIFSAHLFDKYTLDDWAYQQIPHSIVWTVRSDGALLGLTYVREQEMFAWSRHDFGDDLVENVVVVPEDNEDSLYLLIKRTINGQTKRYIEKSATRKVIDIKDSIFVDASLSYDGRNLTATTMTLSGGTTWAYDESLTLTASASFFLSTDVGNQIHLIGSDGTLIRFTIDAYTSATVVTGRPNKTVPVSMRSVATATWSKAVDQLYGLWHLEGKQVSVFADGFVVANPNNDSYDIVTVSNGSITLDKPYAVIHVGLPYVSDIETLDVDTAQGETIVDKSKLVTDVAIFVEESRGIWAGPSAPSDDDTDPKEDLVELKVRDDEGYDDPVALATGVVELSIKSRWNSNGRVFIRQLDPVPLAILAVAPAGKFPFGGG